MTLDNARLKMAAAGIHPRAIDVFSHYYAELSSGATGVIAESDIEPLDDVPHVDDLELDAIAMRDAFATTAMIKLNGGLGTSMGMERAKSLLDVRPGLSFLDVIAHQVLRSRAAHGVRLPLLLMNSFRTRADSLAALERYPDLEVAGLGLDFVQNREPKLLADTLEPVEWPADPSLEWCPPGHGDLYTALEVSGVLDRLLDAGFRYASVSNSDNLGAAPDPRMAGWFASTGAPYAAEVCRRTVADVKGGYLVRRRADGRLVLRETAQTQESDLEAAMDISRHRYFHTNNLWFDLVQLRDALRERAGVLGLPLIRNTKTVDPSDPDSPSVVQIETAMGAAIEVFEGATAIEVDRARFRPVKTTDDLLVLRSDVYEIGADYVLRDRSPSPVVDLDRRYYDTIAKFEARIPFAPSLLGAVSLTVRGDWTFERGVVVQGAVDLTEPSEPQRVPGGSLLSG